MVKSSFHSANGRMPFCSVLFMDFKEISRRAYTAQCLESKLESLHFRVYCLCNHNTHLPKKLRRRTIKINAKLPPEEKVINTLLIASHDAPANQAGGGTWPLVLNILLVF